MRFALPAGASLAAGILLAYYSALDGFGTSVAEARTASTTVLFAGMLGMLWLLERSRGRRRGPVVLLLALMITGYATVIALPAGRRAFELVLPTFPLVVTAVTGVLVARGMAWFALRLMWRTSDAASSRQA